MYDHFSGINFSSSERNSENTMSDIYFHEKSDNSQEMHVRMKFFPPPYKETKHIHASSSDLLHTDITRDSRIFFATEHKIY